MIFKYPIIARSAFLTILKNVIRASVNVKETNIFANVLHDKKSIKISNILTSYGFNYGQVDRILKSPYSIASYKEEDLISNIMTWQMFQVDSRKVFTALTRCSELLTLNPDYINNRAKELLTIFTKKDVCKLLITCPEIFLDDFEDIKEKAEYIVYFMGVEQSSIVKTGAMQFDLKYIKCRHNFIRRCGFYRIKKGAAQAKTAPLNKVFSRNIQTFLKLSGLTKEEYIAFENAYKFEQEEKLLDEEDSDDDN